MSDAATDHLRGHAIYQDAAGQWRYQDNDSLVEFTWHDRPCGKCGAAQREDGHDPCLGRLPGVINACCGHGRDSEAYVQFQDDVLRGAEALDWVRKRIADVVK